MVWPLAVSERPPSLMSLLAGKRYVVRNWGMTALPTSLLSTPWQLSRDLSSLMWPVRRIESLEL